MIAGDMFGIGVCRSRSAHIDGKMGFQSVYLRALLPQRPSLMFRSTFDINVCLVASKARGSPWGTFILSESRCLLPKITVPTHIFIVVFLAPSGLT